MIGVIAKALAEAERHTGVTRDQLLGPLCTQVIFRPRQCVYWVARQRGLTIGQIARAMGRDEGSVRNGIKRVQRALDAGEPWACLARDILAGTKAPARFRFHNDNGRDWLRAA
jgi:hypothetical protein